MFALRTRRRAALAFLFMAIPFTALSQDLLGLARSGDLPALNEALPAGANVEPDTLVKPLYFAAQRGHSDVVAYLLERGAPADAVTTFGTALQIAARGNHTSIMNMLLASGADPNLRGGEETKTPLHDAAERGAQEAAELLLANGADVNARSRKDHPPIHLAARKGRTDMVAWLRSNGATPRSVEDFETEELASADLDEGRVAAEICRGCHALATGESSQGRYPAPNLAGVIGREKAVLDFPYTDALKNLNGTWTPQEVNAFIADPTGVAPGTAMGHAGVQNQATRVNIIAYLATLSGE